MFQGYLDKSQVQQPYLSISIESKKLIEIVIVLFRANNIISSINSSQILVGSWESLSGICEVTRTRYYTMKLLSISASYQDICISKDLLQPCDSILTNLSYRIHLILKVMMNLRNFVL